MSLRRQFTWFLRYCRVFAALPDVWRFRRLNHMPRSSQPATETVAFRVRGLHQPVWLRPGTTDAQVFIDTFVHGYHRPMCRLRRAARILDLGCYTALTCLDLARQYPDATIVGVELDPANAELARRHAAQHGGIQIVEAAIWSSTGRVRFDRHEDWGHAVAATGQHTARAITITALLDELGWQRVDFVKMDIEGAEAELFTAPTWLGRVDQLNIELHPPALAAEVGSVLKSYGFECRAVDHHPAAIVARRP